MSNIPPFKPRPPMVISKALLRSVRRLKIFPNYVRLPTTNVARARLRLSRKHVAERKRQTELIKLLENRLHAASQQLSSLQAVHHTQLLYLQTLTHAATIKHDDLHNLSHPFSTLFEARTTFSSPSFTLSPSPPFIPSPQILPLPLIKPDPIHIQNFHLQYGSFSHEVFDAPDTSNS